MPAQLSDEELQANREFAVAALEQNQWGFVQVTGHLAEGENRRCADGLLCDAFHIDPHGSVAYENLEYLIGAEWPNKIYHKNDTAKMSFREIAKWLRQQWGLGGA